MCSARPLQGGPAIAAVSSLSGLYRPPPPVQGLAAGGQVLLGRAAALQEREGVLAERLALAVQAPPGVVLLAGVTHEVVELRLILGAAQDQGSLGRGDGEGHVVGDPARLGVYGGDDLTLRQV